MRHGDEKIASTLNLVFRDAQRDDPEEGSQALQLQKSYSRRRRTKVQLSPSIGHITVTIGGEGRAS